MRWFLREGWGERAHYGTGEVTMHAARARVLLPVLVPADLTAALHVQAPRTDGGRRVGQRPAAAARGRWAPESGPETIAIPAAVLFRGDNLLTLAARDGAAGRAAAAGSSTGSPGAE